MKNKIIIFTTLLLLSSTSYAGIYTNELSKCLVESTSKEDRVALVKWMFSAASLHPAVKSISSVTKDDLDDANKITANLFMKLLTNLCVKETKKALKFEGQTTIETSFRVLGQVAGRELFSSPEVSAAMAGLEKHIDQEKLQSLLKVK